MASKQTTRKTRRDRARPAAAAPVSQYDPAVLELDPLNPRLSDDDAGASQARLIELMLDRFNIDELAESIIASGYVALDPLVGYTRGENVRILEGNRRVATVKLLLDPNLAPEKYRARWTAYQRRLPAQHKLTIRSLPVHVYGNREETEVASYIGYRHVTGVLTWPALEKAKYIARLVEQYSWSYHQIAERLGTRPSHVEKHYVAYQIVQQARNWGLNGTENMEQSFGILLRGLQAAGIAAFLGVTYPKRPDRSRNPIPATKRDDLASFVEWTFGTDEKRAVLPESRDLTSWGKILQSQEAVAYLRRTPEPDFERAWSKSGGREESVTQALFAAADLLEESVALAPQFRDSADVQEALGQCAFFLKQMLVHFPRISAQQGVRFTDV